MSVVILKGHSTPKFDIHICNCSVIYSSRFSGSVEMVAVEMSALSHIYWN